MFVLRHVFGVLALLLCSTDGSLDRDLKSFPCPDPDDIYPCVCQVIENGMDMDCSLVTSEDQLSQVFSADFPIPTFNQLKIVNNKHLKVLRKGDLGPVSFKIIYIHNGVLEEVQEEALSQSYTTLKTIDLYSNRISSFPFQELDLFSALTTIYMSYNRLTFLPPLHSASLRIIAMSYNLFHHVPADAFKGLTDIREISMISNGLTFQPGTFSGMPKLSYLSIQQNRQNQILEGFIEISELLPGSVHLDSNNITSIAVGGITGLTKGHLYLSDNALQEVPEAVFGPILQGGATVDLNGNPLACRCDIAWIVTNPGYMSLIETGATCSNGNLLTDLDPADYEQLCPSNVGSVVVEGELAG